MSALPGTENTTEILTLGETFTGSLTGPSDIDWIQLQNGSYSSGTFANSTYLTVTGDVDLTNAQVSVYFHYTSYGQDTWSQYYFSIEDDADALARRMWFPELNSTNEVFVSLTGFTGNYTVSIGDTDVLFAGAYDDSTSDVYVATDTVYSGTIDYETDVDFFRYDQAVAGTYYRAVLTPGAALEASDLRLWGSAINYNRFEKVETATGWHLETTFLWQPSNAFSTGFSASISVSDPNNVLQTFTGMGFTFELQDLGTSIGLTNLTAATAQTMVAGQTYSETFAALDVEQFYTFTGVAGASYIVYVDGGGNPDIATATGMSGGVEQVLGNESQYSTNDWVYTGFHAFTTRQLVANTDFTFSVVNENMEYQGRNHPMTISVIEVDDAVGSTTATATALALDTAVVEDLHFHDVDMWSIDVVQGEFYTISMTYAPNSNFAAFFNDQSSTYNLAWDNSSNSRLGMREYTFVAFETGTAYFSVENYTSFTRNGVYNNLTPLDVDGLSYTISVSDGISDDRAAIWSDLAAPATNLNEATPALASGTLDADGFSFNVVSGTTYSILVSDGSAGVYLYTDADTNGSLRYYTNEYREENRPQSAGFAEQDALLSSNTFNVTTTPLGSGVLLTFTADYTGPAGVNVYPGIASGSLYQVYISDNGIDETITDALGIQFDELLTGDGTDETLEGFGGDDTLIGGGGADVLDGGDGDDTASYATATSGIIADLRSGGTVGDAAGDSYISIENVIGSNFNDTIYGNGGGNTLDGNRGNDVLFGGLGEDVIAGGKGSDFANGGEYNDLLYGNEGADTLFGGTGADTIFGGSGNDSLSGGTGADSMRGSDGNDSLIGGAQQDTLFGDGGADLLNGNDGDDFMNGGLGADTLIGGIGNDTLYGGQQADELVGGRGRDLLDAGAGNDILVGNNGNDTLSGSTGDDTIFGNSENDLLNGGSGHDMLDGGGQRDTLNGGTGNDTLTGGAGTDDFVFTGGVGHDVVTDWQNNVDNFDFSGMLQISSMADFYAAANDVGTDLVITLSGANSITVLGASEAQFDAGDLIF